MSTQLDPLETTAPELPSVDQYKKIYSGRKPWEEELWVKKCLPFSDNMPALCYAHGITWKEFTLAFPEVFSREFFYNSIKGPNWPDFKKFLEQDFSNVSPEIINEILDTDRWNLIDHINNDFQWIGKTNRHSYTINDQINFIASHKKRQPKKVLEIGGGVGVLSNTITHLGIECISVDIAEDQSALYNLSSNYYFGAEKSRVDMRSNCISLEIKNIDLTEIDTIMLVESIEHIPEERFDIVWDKIVQNFQGRFIVTNWLDYHPLPITGACHCRAIDDEFYDLLSSSALSCWYRDRSHLVLDF